MRILQTATNCLLRHIVHADELEIPHCHKKDITLGAGLGSLCITMCARFDCNYDLGIHRGL